MITLDKIKIISTLDKIEIINDAVFQTIIKNNMVVEQKYTTISPFLLYIELDYLKNELVIEFTGKILLDRYNELINKDNFRQCLENINQLGFCRLDIDAIQSEDEVVKIDVSKDFDYPDFDVLIQTLRGNICNYNKYVVRKLSNGNFIVEKNVQTKTKKKRLTLYNKGKEIRKSENKAFLSAVTNSDKLLNYFEGKVRAELNLNSKERIRSSLKISDTKIINILNSQATPIWDFMNEIISDDKIDEKINSKSEYLTRLVLEDNDFDLAKVEAKMRTFCAPSTHISQVMKPYRVMLAKITSTRVSNLKGTLKRILC